MPQLRKSRNSVWRVWSGPYSVGGKKRKKVGVVVAFNIRADKLSDFSEENFVKEVAELLIGHASKYDPQ